jgi:hypothetical protein
VSLDLRQRARGVQLVARFKHRVVLLVATRRADFAKRIVAFVQERDGEVVLTLTPGFQGAIGRHRSRPPCADFNVPLTQETRHEKPRAKAGWITMVVIRSEPAKSPGFASIGSTRRKRRGICAD